MSTVYCLILHCQDDEDPCELEVLMVSPSKRALKERIEALVTPFEEAECENAKANKENETIMREYLERNRHAIVQFKSRKAEVPEQIDKTIWFLVANWTFSLPDFASGNSFVQSYCDVDKLTRPFPTFKARKVWSPKRVYTRGALQIKKARFSP